MGRRGDEKCLKLGIRAVGIDDGDYPAKLKDLKDPPLVLHLALTAIYFLCNTYLATHYKLESIWE